MIHPSLTAHYCLSTIDTNVERSLHCTILALLGNLVFVHGATAG